MKGFFLAVLAAFALAQTSRASSFYPVRLDDSTSVYLTPPAFPVHADGVADDSQALQMAIDKVQETTKQGIVFVPSGRYRITKTIYVWPGVRVIGYGPTRPVIVLKDHTPGYDSDLAYMFFFAGGRPGHEPTFARTGGRPRTAQEIAHKPFPGTVPASADVVDANAGTFYSAMSNVDFEVGDGNAGAVGIRFHVAQHCYLTHMDFHMGSGMAALHDIGNEAEDLHFYGGRYGIMTVKPSPGWQFTLIDSTFERQRESAIKEQEAGLTLVRDQFRHVPSAISINPGYSDELWIEDSRFEDISGPAITISNEMSPRTEITAENVLCQGVHTFALFRESQKTVAGPSATYRVKIFSHGLSMADTPESAQIKTEFDAVPANEPLPALTAAIAAPPAVDTWINLRTLGAKGDGVTDDTAAIQKAIDEHRTIYVPSGRYLVSDTIMLRPDTVLIGLHPSTTQFFLADSTPAFDGPGAPKALLQTPQGGTNIVSGIGVYPGGINSRAIGVLWMAGKDSLMDDVRFLGGHGTNNPDGTRSNPYNNTHTADPDLRKRWDGQYPSLWVTKGGGGTFANIWTPDTYSQAGMYVSGTTTPGRVYELSSEHHVRTEVKLDHVENWKYLALQTEEERGEGPFALPLEIDNSSNILIANMHAYRVISSYQPYPYAIRVMNSQNVRFRNLHVDSNSKVCFDDSVFDQTRGVDFRSREVGSLTLTGEKAAGEHAGSTAPVEKLAGGFFNASGAALDAQDRLYFVDAHWQRIYRWSPATRQLEIVRDSPIDATNLAFDKAGNLIVVSYAGDGTVYSFPPDSPMSDVTVLKPQPNAPRPGMQSVLAVGYWKGREAFEREIVTPKPYQFVSIDGTTFLPAREDFMQGTLSWGMKMAEVLRAFSLAEPAAGKRFYVTDEPEEKTYSAKVEADGSLSDLKLFVERGGECVTTDAAGNVYLAAGQVYVYNPNGELLKTIDVPERPTDIVLSKDGRTLFMLARTSLYSVQVGAR